MANEQMGMPAAAPSMEDMAVYDQMRQNISPKEFSDELLASASQVDPQAVAEFKQDLEGLEMPPEVLDALNDVVDEILANPERYAELRQRYMDQGLPEDILPEQFDPQFFAALNMAIDQMIAAPAGPQAFAKGGIAELKPIAKALASYGRNGDTMLAHITPAEARMLRRRGGSGTTNPDTGLPEFFNLFKAVGKVFKSVGRAVKKFVNSSVGRLVTTVALGFFLGPAAASMLGVSSAAGVAAVSGFVGSAGSTLLGGGSIRDALKAGAIGGLTAGVAGGVTQGFSTPYAGPTTVGGQWDKLMGNVPAPALAPVETATPAPNISASGQVAGMAPAPDMSGMGAEAPLAAEAGAPLAAEAGAPFDATAQQGSLAKAPLPSAPTKVPTVGESFKTIGEGLGMGEGPASMDTFKKGLGQLFMPEGASQAQINAATRDLMAQNPGMSWAEASKQASSSMTPTALRSYGPMAAAGLGIMGLTGGFQSKPVEGGPITKSLMIPPSERIRQEGSEKKYYVQGLPGVQYNEKGEPIPGSFTGLPTYGLPDYSGGYGMPGGQNPMQLPPAYIPPPGAIGSRQVAQPYNTADMYSNLLYPRGYDDGGEVAKTPEQIAEERRAADAAAQARAATEAQQKAARDAVAMQKALQRAQGFGTAYANLNAGLSYNAPEVNPLDASDTTFGQRNREQRAAYLQQLYGAALGQQRAAQQRNAATLGQPATPPSTPEVGIGDFERNYRQQLTTPAPQPFPGATTPAPKVPGLEDLVRQQYATIGRTGMGTDPSQIDKAGYEYWLGRLKSGSIAPENFSSVFNTAVDDYLAAKPEDPYSTYVKNFRKGPSMSTSGIATLAQGGYPRMNGQISGPGTEKSDSIPAMLSDGEFVMTAKAVRGMGKGSRREGAKKMYKLMHQLERNAQRG